MTSTDALAIALYALGAVFALVGPLIAAVSIAKGASRDAECAYRYMERPGARSRSHPGCRSRRCLVEE